MAVKYVNMADIILDTDGDPAASPGQSAVGADDQREIVALIELLFFAYRDFVSDPDQILDDFGVGVSFVEDRAAIIAYMRQQAASPAPLPTCRRRRTPRCRSS